MIKGNILFTWDDLVAGHPIKKLTTIFAGAGASVISATSDGKARRLAGYSYKTLDITFADSQHIELMIKQTGDVFQVKLNGLVIPLKDPDDHKASVKELVAKMDAGRSKFQKKMALVKVELPAGIRSTAAKQSVELAARVVDLDTKITAAVATRDALKAELGVLDSIVEENLDAVKTGEAVVHGRNFKTKVFASVSDANDYIKKNSEWGVLTEVGKEGDADYEVHVAKKSDNGTALDDATLDAAKKPKPAVGDDVHNKKINKLGSVRKVEGDKVLVRSASGLDTWDLADVDIVEAFDSATLDAAFKLTPESSDEDKLKWLKKKGNIITFKEAFYPKGDNFTQIVVVGFVKQKDSVKIEGRAYDTPWMTVKELINAVDWDWMQRNLDSVDDGAVLDDTLQIAAGTIIKVAGLPFVANENTSVEGLPENLRLAQALSEQVCDAVKLAEAYTDCSTFDSADLGSAREVLLQALSVVETNYPINMERGDVDQANLELANAASFKAALAVLDDSDTIDPETLTSGQRDVLRALANGRTDDGDMPSKSSRDELAEMGLIDRYIDDKNNVLTAEGEKVAALLDSVGDPVFDSVMPDDSNDAEIKRIYQLAKSDWKAAGVEADSYGKEKLANDIDASFLAFGIEKYKTQKPAGIFWGAAYILLTEGYEKEVLGGGDIDKIAGVHPLRKSEALMKKIIDTAWGKGSSDYLKFANSKASLSKEYPADKTPDWVKSNKALDDATFDRVSYEQAKSFVFANAVKQDGSKVDLVILDDLINELTQKGSVSAGLPRVKSRKEAMQVAKESGNYKSVTEGGAALDSVFINPMRNNDVIFDSAVRKSGAAYNDAVDAIFATADVDDGHNGDTAKVGLSFLDGKVVEVTKTGLYKSHLTAKDATEALDKAKTDKRYKNLKASVGGGKALDDVCLDYAGQPRDTDGTFASGKKNSIKAGANHLRIAVKRAFKNPFSK